jgi:heme exporter protein A
MTLTAQQLACTRGERDLFDALDIELHAGDAMRIAGNNGAGKTSLLRILCGLAAPTSGTVFWDGVAIASMREQFCRQLTYLGHLSGIKDDFTAHENVMMACALAGNPVSRNAVYDALERTGLGAQADLPTRVLSQGQKKRVALTRLQFCRATPLWILDEPFAALDQHAQLLLTETLNQHLDNNGMLAYSTHQEMTLRARRNVTLELAAPC